MQHKHIEGGGAYLVIDMAARFGGLLSLFLLPAVFWGRGKPVVRWLLIGLLFPALWIAFAGFICISSDEMRADPPPFLIEALYPVIFAPAALILWAIFWPLRKRP